MVDGAIAADALIDDVVVVVVIAGIADVLIDAGVDVVIASIVDVLTAAGADALIDANVDVVIGAIIDDVAAGISVTDREPLEVCFANCPGSTSLDE